MPHPPRILPPSLLNPPLPLSLPLTPPPPAPVPHPGSIPNEWLRRVRVTLKPTDAGAGAGLSVGTDAGAGAGAGAIVLWQRPPSLAAACSDPARFPPTSLVYQSGGKRRVVPGAPAPNPNPEPNPEPSEITLLGRAGQAIDSGCLSTPTPTSDPDPASDATPNPNPNPDVGASTGGLCISCSEGGSVSFVSDCRGEFIRLGPGPGLGQG